MNYISINLYITEYGTHNLAPHCFLVEVIDEEVTSRKLDYHTALKMMWELQLAGAEKTIRVHGTEPSINYREIHFWARH